MPINAYPHPSPRPESRLSLERGGTLLMYTDGLLESRNRPRDGVAELLDAVATRLHEPVDALVESVAQALRDPAEADDIDLLATRLS